jgi:hypothetical protein
VALKPEGIPSSWIGIDSDANVHHWAATFVLGYAYGEVIGTVIHTCREIPGIDLNNMDNFNADVELGNRAVRMGRAFANNEFVTYPGLERGMYWQRSFDDLWKKYMTTGD